MIETNREIIKILLVDDKPENLLAMESILEQENYVFIKAYSAKEALKILLNEADFALILMDVNMPEMSGFDTAKMIYKREKLAHIPIIFITANDYSEESLFKGYLSGGVDYIVKPVNPALLKVKVHIFIELYKKNRQLFLHEQKLKQINYDLEKQIEEKQKIEEELRLRNLQLSEAQKLTHIGSWDWNLLSNMVSGSEEIYAMYELAENNAGFNMEELLNKIHPADLEKTSSGIAHAISHNTSFDIFFRYITSGHTKHINLKGRLVTNDKNEVIKISGTSQDITNLKRTEEQLKIFNLLEKMMNEIYVISANDFKLLYANADALRNLGYDFNDIRELNFSGIFKEYKKTVFKKMIAPLVNGEKDKIVFFGNFKRKNKSAYPVELHLQLIEQGENKVFLVVALDLTERKRTEQVLTASLREKEILLKEIHHRVKNNLQIIYSLLNLQSSTVDDEHIIEIFKESQNRIKSMALIHEKLYKHNNLSLIDFTEYLNDLVTTLVYSYKVNTSDIQLKLNSDQIYLSIDLSISLGLCITELVTNTFKYAFPDGKKGEVTLDLSLNDNNILTLSVKDNGIGLPEKFDYEANDSLGLKLVSSLAEQHYGTLSIESNGITCFKLEIPIKEDTVTRSLNSAGDNIPGNGSDQKEEIQIRQKPHQTLA
ncbi:MAG: histidine kinase dimerization/phosphoacceptor domain -containing protein [Ignavibacteriaceae bacterium]